MMRLFKSIFCFLFFCFLGAKICVEAKVQLSYKKGYPKLGCPETLQIFSFLRGAPTGGRLLIYLFIKCNLIISVTTVNVCSNGIYPSVENNSGHFKSTVMDTSFRVQFSKNPKMHSIYIKVPKKDFDSLVHTAFFFLSINQYIYISILVATSHEINHRYSF